MLAVMGDSQALPLVATEPSAQCLNDLSQLMLVEL